MKKVDCYLCGSSQADVLFKNELFPYFVCYVESLESFRGNPILKIHTQFHEKSRAIKQQLCFGFWGSGVLPYQ